MGDFEDVFGAGADADDIIDGYSRDYIREQAALKRAAKRKPFPSTNIDIEDWRASMSARGYIKGPRFNSYDELSKWDKSNRRPHIRRRNSDGFEVFFTNNNADY